MQRRVVIGLMTVAPIAVLLGACGGDDGATPATVPAGDSTLPPVVTDPPAGAAYVHPSGTDDVVIEITVEGGFTTPEIIFTTVPSMLVTGDRVIQPGPVPAIYPGPLVPNVLEQPISEAGIQELLALADEHGLLQDREYVQPDGIADAPDTVVSVTVDGVTHVHRAYALGLAADGRETDPARAELAGFVSAAQEYVFAADNPTLGSVAPFVADEYLLRSRPVDDTSGFEIEPTFVDWPADATVRLVDASDCVAVPATEVAELFASATQLTFFSDGGVDYSIAVKPLLPGDGC